MNVSPLILFGIAIFLIGVAVFCIGSMLIREAEKDLVRVGVPGDGDDYDAAAPTIAEPSPINPRLAEAMAGITGQPVAAQPPQSTAIPESPAPLEEPAQPPMIDIAEIPEAVPVAALSWTHDVTGDREGIEPELRVDMIERLAMVGLPWCEKLLERAVAEDDDALVRDAAERALLVVRARPTASQF